MKERSKNSNTIVLHTENHTFGPSHHKSYDKVAMKKTILLAMCLVFIFMTVEFIGGYLSKSIALMADAGHMLTDFISLIISFIGLHISQRNNDNNRTYGYSRFEVVLSLFNSLFLMVVCLYIVYEAILRFLNPVSVNPIIMLPVAIVGLIINFVIMYLFHYSEKKNTALSNKNHEHKMKNLLMQSAILHFVADTLGSIIAIIVAIIIYYTNWHIVDPILSVVLVLLISNGTVRIVSSSIYILMEGTPQNIKVKTVEKYLEANVKEIIDIHHIHLWMLNEEENIITLHAVLAKDANFHIAITNIKLALKEQFGINHATIQVEEYSKSCVEEY